MDKLSSLLGGDAGESPAQAMKEKVLHETIESKVASVTSEKVADSAPVQKVCFLSPWFVPRTHRRDIQADDDF